MCSLFGTKGLNSPSSWELSCWRKRPCPTSHPLPWMQVYQDPLASAGGNSAALLAPAHPGDQLKPFQWLHYSPTPSMCFLPSPFFPHRLGPRQHSPVHFLHTSLHLRDCFLETLTGHTRNISITCDWNAGQVQWRIHLYLFSYAWLVPVSSCFRGQLKIT